MNNFSKISISIFALIALTGCTVNVTNNDSNNSSGSSSDGIQMSEVAKHNKATDCWTVISDSVYNITNYVNQHPGGSDQISKSCGIDGTSLFNTQGGTGGTHSRSAKSLMEEFYIGDLAK